MGTPTIIFQDDDLLVLNKPAGITVNRSDTTVREQTVQDWVAERFAILKFQLSGDLESDFMKRAGIVHRLDKETSGILLVAKSESAFIELQRQFKERLVHKTYQALAHGEIAPPTGEINVPVGRTPWNRTHFGVVAGGREARTFYKVLALKHLVMGKTREALSFVELYPETGRTHQIRVHLQYLRHPIFSDELYAGRKTSRDDRKLLPRVFLHAASISFIHPTKGKLVQFQAPLTEELKHFLDSLEN